jgi:hypothetical protein
VVRTILKYGSIILTHFLLASPTASITTDTSPTSATTAAGGGGSGSGTTSASIIAVSSDCSADGACANSVTQVPIPSSSTIFTTTRRRKEGEALEGEEQEILQEVLEGEEWEGFQEVCPLQEVLEVEEAQTAEEGRIADGRTAEEAQMVEGEVQTVVMARVSIHYQKIAITIYTNKHSPRYQYITNNFCNLHANL